MVSTTGPMPGTLPGWPAGGFGVPALGRGRGGSEVDGPRQRSSSNRSRSSKRTSRSKFGARFHPNWGKCSTKPWANCKTCVRQCLQGEVVCVLDRLDVESANSISNHAFLKRALCCMVGSRALFRTCLRLASWYASCGRLQMLSACPTTTAVAPVIGGGVCVCVCV